MAQNAENIELIKDKALSAGLLRNQLAYVLATAQWETNHTFEPVREAYYLKSKAEAYRKKLRYYPWYGRGFVQLTWQENYAKAAEKLKRPLILADPDSVMAPHISAEILVQGMKEGWFTGKKLSDYITLKVAGFVNARRIINGTDKAKEIADIAKEWDAKLKAEGYGEATPAKPVNPIPTIPAGEPVETHEEQIAPLDPPWLTPKRIFIMGFALVVAVLVLALFVRF